MTQQVLLIGATGGIGSSLSQLMSCNREYNIVEWSSKDLDLNNPRDIFQHDLSKFDIVINCAGHSQGTYLGFLNNTLENQLSQITVNYTSNLMLLKHYANSRNSGKYVWISTISMDRPRPFHSVYASSKTASKFAIDLIRQEATHIDILEAKVGLVKTNLRYRNFGGTKTKEEVDATYGNDPLIPLDTVAQTLLEAIEQNLTEVNIL
jgi:short-subunit dehydrogenase